jgi:predicted component of viral defense system (DUF524 family)
MRTVVEEVEMSPNERDSDVFAIRETLRAAKESAKFIDAQIANVNKIIDALEATTIRLQKLGLTKKAAIMHAGGMYAIDFHPDDVVDEEAPTRPNHLKSAA